MRLAFALGLFVSAAACSSPKEVAPPPSPHEPALATAPDASAAPVASADAGVAAACDTSKVPHALVDLPCVPDDEVIRMRPLGSSRDKKWFGRCLSACETCGLDCAFVEVATQKPKKFRFADERRGMEDRTPSAADRAISRRDEGYQAFLQESYGDPVDARQGPMPRSLSGPFPYDDIVFAVQSGYDEKTGKATFAFGARVGDEAAVYPFAMSFGPHEGWKYQPHVDPKLRGAERAAALEQGKADMRASFTIEPPVLAAFDVSPDGKYAGFIAFASGTRFVELGDMRWMETTALVGRLYNEAGFVAHKAGRYAASSALFGKAVRAADQESLYAYNQACALARLNDAGTRAALARAIELGGRKIAVRAKSDADFESVRQAPWFVAATR